MTFDIKDIMSSAKPVEEHQKAYIYFLIKGEEIIYVGSSMNNYYGRLMAHVKVFDFDNVTVFEVDVKDRTELLNIESDNIINHKPAGNKVFGTAKRDDYMALTSYVNNICKNAWIPVSVKNLVKDNCYSIKQGRNIRYRVSELDAIKDKIVSLIQEANNNKKSFNITQKLENDNSFEELKNIYSAKQAL